MSDAPSSTLLVRIDPARNMARYYGLTVEASLFGDHAVVRRWGRIGTRGRFLIELHESAEAARRRFEALAAAKRHRGYRPVS